MRTNYQPALISHGLSRREPLTVESIIRGCFSNPNRKSFPDFVKIKGRGDSINIYTENENPDYLLSRLEPGLIEMFDNAKIILENTSKFKNKTLDEEPYLNAIRA